MTVKARLEVWDLEGDTLYPVKTIEREVRETGKKIGQGLGAKTTVAK